MKKDTDQNSFPDSYQGDDANVDKEEFNKMARYHWTDEVPNFLYNGDVRRIDLHYNVLWKY